MPRQSNPRDVIAEQRASQDDFRLQRARQGSRLTTDRWLFPDCHLAARLHTITHHGLSFPVSPRVGLVFGPDP